MSKEEEVVKVVVRVWSFSRRDKHSRLCLIGIFGGYEYNKDVSGCIYKSILGEFLTLINLHICGFPSPTDLNCLVCVLTPGII